MRTMTTIDLRKKLGSILNSVSNNREQVVISRANKPLAVIISVDEYEKKVVKKDRGQRLKEISCGIDMWRKRHEKEASKVDVVKAVRIMRDSR